MQHGSVSDDEMVVSVVDALPPDRRVGRSETIPRWGMTSRLTLGLITFAMPAIASLLAIAALAAGGEPPPILLGATFGFFITHGLVTLFYLAFAGQNPRLRSRARWQLALILAGPITIPAYWFMHVWAAPRVGRGDEDGNVPGMDVREARRMALAF
jgi:hypothetical protein